MSSNRPKSSPSATTPLPQYDNRGTDQQFIISQSPSKNVVNLDWTIIWAFNKKAIDPISPPPHRQKA